VPEAIDAVILKSLARDPAERWQSAAEMSRALEAAHPRAGQDALSRIAPEPPSAVHSVTTGASAFAPTIDAAPPLADAQREITEIVSRSSVRRSSPRTAFVALGLVLVAGAATAGFFVWSRRPRELPSMTTSTVATESAPSAPSMPPVPSPPLASSTPAVVASVAPRPAVKPSRPAPSASAAAASPASARPSCDPPYRVDERGVRVFRTECL
jgi:serine/threonine-protein kinase